MIKIKIQERLFNLCALTDEEWEMIQAGREAEERIEELEKFVEALAQYPTKAEREILCEKAEAYLIAREVK